MRLDAKYAATVGSRRARHWRVRSSPRLPELYIEREGLEQRFHVSLHESGHWHLKHGRQVAHTWPRPDEWRPGYTKAVMADQPTWSQHALRAHRCDGLNPSYCSPRQANGSTPLAAYVIAHLTVTDPDRYAAYAAGFVPVLHRHGGKLLIVDDDIEVLEGKPLRGRHVILEFPDRAAATAWYDSAGYQAILPHRQAGSTTHFVAIAATPPAVQE